MDSRYINIRKDGRLFRAFETNEIVVTLVSTFTNCPQPEYNKPHHNLKNQPCCFVHFPIDFNESDYNISFLNRYKCFKSNQSTLGDKFLQITKTCSQDLKKRASWKRCENERKMRRAMSVAYLGEGKGGGTCPGHHFKGR